MNLTNKILMLILVMLIPVTLWATNSQDDGRTYFTVDQASVNLAGDGYDSDGNGTPFNYDITGFFRIEVPSFCTITSVVTDEGGFYGINWTAGGMGALTTVETDVPIIGNGTAGNAVTLDYGVGLSVVAGELVNTVTDTDTDTVSLIAGQETPAVVLAVSETIAGYPIPTSTAGTADYVTAFFPTWSPVLGTDTVTLTVSVNGVAQDTVDITPGGGSEPGSHGGAISVAIAVDNYVQVKAQVTTQDGGLDTITIQSYTINEVIL